jgi:hypothetical protein
MATLFPLKGRLGSLIFKRMRAALVSCIPLQHGYAPFGEHLMRRTGRSAEPKGAAGDVPSGPVLTHVGHSKFRRPSVRIMR